MCGRFTQAYTWRELVSLYRLTQPAVNLQPHYNVAPTETADTFIPRETGLALVPMRWGPDPLVVEKAQEGTAVHLQRARRERCRQADIPRRIQTGPVHHSGQRLLRMEADAERQAALLHQRS
jgi:putative SOS response-associated peptidase YedK